MLAVHHANMHILTKSSLYFLSIAKRGLHRGLFSRNSDVKKTCKDKRVACVIVEVVTDIHGRGGGGGGAQVTKAKGSHAHMENLYSLQHSD